MFIKGQTLDKVGLYLEHSPCFAHGQFYTAMSRVRHRDNIRVCTKERRQQVKDVVYQDIVDKEDIDMATEFYVSK